MRKKKLLISYKEGDGDCRLLLVGIFIIYKGITLF